VLDLFVDLFSLEVTITRLKQNISFGGKGIPGRFEMEGYYDDFLTVRNSREDPSGSGGGYCLGFS